jgi:hypothetical protein
MSQDLVHAKKCLKISSVLRNVPKSRWNVWHGHIRSNNSLTLAITRVHIRNFIFLFTFCLRSMFCVPCCLYLWIVHFWFGCTFAFLYCLFNVSMTLSYSIKLAEISEHFLVRTRSWDRSRPCKEMSQDLVRTKECPKISSMQRNVPRSRPY